jgi:hypothetical protein
MSTTAFSQESRAAPKFSMPSDPASGAAFDTALIMLALFLPTLVAMMFDERRLSGADIWMKPLHFQLSIFIHFAALVLLLQLMTPAGRASRLIRWSMTSAATAAVCEIGYIMLQAARGRASHFNASTPIETVMYPLMGVGATIIVIGSFLVGVQIWRQGRKDIDAGLRLGAILGLTLGSAATLIIAATMSSGLIDGPGHWVGGVHSDANGLPFFGWSTTGGDLRAPHFFATHGIEALPLAGFLADRIFGSQAPRAVWAATGLWAALVAATFAMALAGTPLLRL